MYLERLVPPPADAGQFDRSGLWINADDGGYRVTSVVAGSPAAEGGVATGDQI
jgi:C-terminal processing protease CtpA/Prc